MKTRVCCIGVLILLAGLPLASFAGPPEKPVVAVLADAADPGLTKTAGKAAVAAQKAVPSHIFMVISAKDAAGKLSLKASVGATCKGDAACVAGLGGKLGAKFILLVGVGPDPGKKGEFRLRVQAIDVAKKAAMSEDAKSLGKKAETAAVVATQSASKAFEPVLKAAFEGLSQAAETSFRASDFASAFPNASAALKIKADVGRMNFIAGMSRFKEKRGAEAKPFLLKAKKAMIEPGEVNFALGTIESEKGGNPKLAKEYFSAAAAAGKSTFESRMFLGRYFYKAKDFKAAVEHLNGARGFNPADGEANFLFGKIKYAESPASAKPFLEAAFKAKYNAGETAYLLGKIAREEKNDKGVEYYFASALAAKYENAEIYKELGKISLARGFAVGAEKNLRAALKLAPKDVETSYILGRLLFEAKKEKEAEGFLLAATPVKEYAGNACLMLGRIYDGRKDERKAVEFYAKAVAAGAADAQANLVVGRSLYKSGKGKDAQVYLKKAIDLKAKPGEAEFYLGKLAYAAKDFKAATYYLSIAGQNGFEKGEASYVLGIIAKEDKDGGKAIGHFDAAAAVGYETVKSNMEAARLRIEQKDNAGAEKNLRAVLAAKAGGAEAAFLLGKLLFDGGKKNEAAKHLESAATAKPYTGKANLMLGNIAMAAGKREKALDHYRKAYEGGAKDPEAAKAMGLYLAGKGKTAEAEKLLAEALKAFPADAEINYYLGKQKFKAGKRAEAAGHLKQALAGGKDPVEMNLMLGKCALDGKDEKAAQGYFKAAIDAGAKPPEPHMGLAKLYAKAGSKVEAEGVLRTLLKAAPDHAEGNLMLGRMLFEGGKQADAKPFLEKVMDAGKERGKVRLMLASAALAAADEKGARAHYLKAYEYGERGYELELAIAEDLIEKKKIAEAEKYLRGAQKRKPDDGHVNWLLGGLEFDKGDFKAAERHLITAHKAGFHKVEAACRLGEIAQKGGREEEAAGYFKDAADGGTDRPEAYYGAGFWALKKGNAPDAEKYLKKGLELKPGDGEADFAVGKIRFEAADFAAAKPHLKAALDKDVKKVEALSLLARVSEAGGDRKGAKNYYAEALKVEPKNQEAAKKLGVMEFEDGGFDKATEHLKIYTAAAPDDVAAGMMLGKAYLALKKTKDARATFEAMLKVLEKKGGDPYAETLKTLAGLTRDAKQYKESQKHAEALLKAKPHDRWAVDLYGMNALDIGGKSDEAKKLLEAEAGALPPVPEAAYYVGVFAETKGENAEALGWYRKAFEADSSFLRAGEKLAKLLIAQSGFAEAEKVAEQVVKLDPDNAGGYYLRGEIAAGSGNAGKALEWYGEALKRNPKFFPALSALGRLEAKAGNFEAAEKRLGEAHALKPDDAETCFAYGQITLKKGRTKETKELFACAMKAFGSEPRLLYPYGSLLMQSGDVKGAAKLFADLVKNQPDSAEGWFYVGLSQEKLGNRKDADEAFAKYVELRAMIEEPKTVLSSHAKPLFSPAWLEYAERDVEKDDPMSILRHVGLIHAKAGETALAEKELSEAVKGKPDCHCGLYNLGTFYLEANRPAEAVDPLKRAQDLKKEADGWLNLAAAYLWLGKVKEAEGALGAMTKKEAATPDAAIDKAILSAMSGKFDVAKAALEKLAAERPKDAKAAYNLAAVLFMKGDMKGAEAALKIPLKARETEAEAAYLMAKVKEKQKDGAKAEAYYHNAIGYEPRYVNARYDLGSMYFDGGSFEQAQEQLTRAVEFDPDYGDAHSKLGLVYGKLGLAKKELAHYQKANDLSKKEREVSKKAEAKSVAVARFKNASGKKEDDWLAVGIAEAMTTDLQNLSGFKVIETSQIEKVLKDMELAQAGIADEATAKKVGSMVEAEVLLVGSYQVAGKEIRMDGRLIDVGTAAVVKAGSASGKMGDLFKVERELALAIVSDYAGVSEQERSNVMNANATSLDNLRTIAQGRLLLFAGNREAAKELFRKAMEEDPKYAAAMEEMQKAWGDVAATMAILPFTNTTKSAEAEWLSRGIPESLTTDLKKITGIFLVERMNIEKALEEMSLSQMLDMGNSPKVGQFIGASILCVGSYQAVGDGVQIDARMVDAESGQVLMAGKVEGKLERIFELESKLAQDIAKALNVEVTPAEKDLLAKGKPSLDDFKRFMKAQTKLAVESGAGRELNVVVSGFKGETKGEDEEKLAGSMRSYFTQGFLKNGGVTVVDKEATLKALEKAGLDLKGAEARSVREKAAELAVDGILYGSVQVAGDQVRLNARVVGTKGNEVLAASSASGLRSDIGRLRRYLLEDTLRALGAQVNPGLADAMAALYPEEGAAGKGKAEEEKGAGGLFWTKITLGGSLAMGVGSGAMFLMMQNYNLKAQREYDSASAAIDPDVRDTYSQRYDDYRKVSKYYQYGALAAGSLAVIGLGYSLYEIFTYDEPEVKGEVKEADAPDVRIVPVPQEAGAGIAIGGSF